MTDRDYRVYLRDIIERIGMIDALTIQGRELWEGSLAHREATIRCIEVIGEAVKRLPIELTSKHPEIEWSDRNARFHHSSA
ncbi:MAG: hypothetical protein OHK0023_24070 [Anaerolineae bacterium]